MKPRSYQTKAVAAIYDAWQRADSTLLVLPTGMGKTIVIAYAIAQRQGGRVMLLAHREELIFQGADKIATVTGVTPDIEMAELVARDSLFDRSSVVVSTIQTQNAGRRRRPKRLADQPADASEETNVSRMTKFNPHEFSMLVVDECHHATAKTYRRVIDHFRQNPKLKILGVTATPDRRDEEALGQVFQTVAFDYELLDAINEGWLVPIQQRAIHVQGLDYSAVRTTAGDLNGADLARVMEYEDALHGIASPTIEMIGDRRTLVFASSVPHAERLCEIFNRHKSGMARFVYGETPKDERRAMLRDYAAGQFQILVNVGVATEGFDEPGIQVVVIARPTKSRALYAQMVGRGTRPLPGLVDRFPDDQPDLAARLRRDVIAASSKPCVEVIDFVGNSGRHKLMSTADILGGRYSEQVLERAKAKAKSADGKPVNMTEALADSEREVHEEKERAARASLKLKAKFTWSTVNPFDVLQIEPWTEKGWNKGRLPSEKQLACLDRFGVARDQVKTFTQASQLISELIERRQKNQCTMKQARILAKHGHSTDVSFEDASKIIDGIAHEQGWGKPKGERPSPPPSVTVY